MTKQGMMLVLDDLEQRGYVRRVPDRDARAKVVRLTARGRRFVAEARRASAAVEARARRDLGDRRYETLRDALEARGARPGGAGRLTAQRAVRRGSHGAGADLQERADREGHGGRRGADRHHPQARDEARSAR